MTNNNNEDNEVNEDNRDHEDHKGKEEKAKTTVQYLRGSRESRLNKRTKLWPRTRWVTRALIQKSSHKLNDESICWIIPNIHMISDHIRDRGLGEICIMIGTTCK